MFLLRFHYFYRYTLRYLAIYSESDLRLQISCVKGWDLTTRKHIRYVFYLICFLLCIPNHVGSLEGGWNVGTTASVLTHVRMLISESDNDFDMEHHVKIHFRKLDFHAHVSGTLGGQEKSFLMPYIGLGIRTALFQDGKSLAL